MSRSIDLDGVHGTENTLYFGPGNRIAQISAEQWGTAMEDDLAIRVHGVIPLPMGIANEDRCE